MSDGIGLDAFERRAWPEAFETLFASDQQSDLSAADLERYGLVAHLVGRDQEGARAWERAYQAFLESGVVASAARCAFWLGMGFMQRGEMAKAGGWFARTERILEESDVDCPERGLARVPEGLQLLDGGEPEAAKAVFDDMRMIGSRFQDRNVVTLGCLGGGQALIRMGDLRGGVARLDEAMISVVSNEVSPLVAGIVYCAVVETCQEVFDFGRAQEWTEALTTWCDDQPGLVPFQGQCQVYRAEIIQLHGNWTLALEAAKEAEQRLSGPPMHPAIGAAYYQQGEVHRLRGALTDAEDAYRRAEELGRRPEPGRALLRLAHGRTEAAATAIAHALNETTDEIHRAPLLIAATEIALAAKDTQTAKRASNELASLAATFDSPFLRASSQHAQGAVLLAEKDPGAAVSKARGALEIWQALDAPYETARSHALLARGATSLGDAETASTHLEAARTLFRDLGAVTDLSRIEPSAGGNDLAAHGLTPRELEVLRLIATGMTNRAIAANLTISEKTVANHVGNVLGKLGLSSRAAATAFAYENHLV